ncbi:multiprotein-bridging factor 1 family protein [Nocardia fluminea]|uniref:helix-turn-helix domain-containing protein n=1 Tax=Nocardia fluminea TaxID=134984 RepID=UPI0036490A58
MRTLSHRGLPCNSEAILATRPTCSLVGCTLVCEHGHPSPRIVMTLGQQIRSARLAADLSLRELARRIERAPSYMNDIEHDRRVPSESVLADLAAALSLDLDQLLATAGRVGEGAEQYMKSQPMAGMLLRRVSDAEFGERELKTLIEQADKIIDKRTDE